MIDFQKYRPKSFSSCFDKRLIKIDGHPQLCRCGKCDACRQSSKSRTASLLDSEIKNWKYCIFFTLTYAPEYVPCVQVRFTDCGCPRFVPVGRSVDLLPYVPINPHEDYLRFHDNYHIYYESYSVDVISDIPFLHNSTVPNTFGVLCYKDVQLFKKKFIKNYFNYVKKQYPFVFAEGTPRYKIFYCGEYGSRFYRPHFHLLFMYDCPQLVEDLNVFRDYVFDNWSIRKRVKGYRNKFEIKHFASRSRFTTEFETDKNPNFSFVDTSSSVSSYVSSYVSSGSNLPRCLQFRPWRPKTVSPRGKYSSFGADEVEDVEIMSKIKCCFNGQTEGTSICDYFKRVESVYNPQSDRWESTSVPYSVNCIRTLFCKPYGYSSLSHYSFKHLLTQFSATVSGLFYSFKEQLGVSSLLEFIDHREFKSIVSSRFIFHTVFLTQKESTWLFCRNGLRTMLRFNLDIDYYMDLFHFLWDYLIPQVRLGDFYNEQIYFVQHGLSPRTLLSFYDVLPDCSVEWSRDWFSTFNINFPVDNLNPEVVKTFIRSCYSSFKFVLVALDDRERSILFTHYKHHSRSDF